MKLTLISPFSLGLIIRILFFLIAATTPQPLDHDNYSKCREKYSCGLINDIKYPFWGNNRPSYCGLQGYEIKCQVHPIFNMSSQLFVVLGIEKSNSIMRIARADWLNNNCSSYFVQTTIDSKLFEYSSSTKNLTLFYSCKTNDFNFVEQKEKLHCEENDGIVPFGDTDKIEANEKCEKSKTILVTLENIEEFKKGNFPVIDLMNKGFEVGYEMKTQMQKCENCENSGGVCGTNSTQEFTCFCKDNKPRDLKCPGYETMAKMKICETCEKSGGVCGTNSNTYEFTCFCEGKPHSSSCPGKSHVRRNIGIAFAALVGALLIAGLALLLYRKKRAKTVISSWESRDISSYGSSVLDLEKSSSYYGVQVFEYNDLQEATNNFDENKELGDGGFGVVYQGKLRDGRVVAVKRLYERSFKRAEQFKNEVEILAKLRHRNLVTLYGCTSRSSRELLLVYEYVSNGTVADHLHGEQAKPGSLPWTTRMSIAVETADALLFLHKSDVIHRDVKTNNILLDGNFVVKVADFGLSRLYPNNVTHVSTAPQGTPGYVDPEYHQCYRLTNKSDVYSFGVVLIELISSMPAVDITRHRHYINLANMAIDKIQNHALSEIVDPYLGFDSDFKVKKMINGVAELAFQCLQDGKDMRPTMEEAFEILKTISSEDYCAIIEEMEISGDGVELLKSEPPAVSSGSTSSNCTTPVTSG